MVIFGPQQILRHFSGALNLLELEDYTQDPPDQIFSWEMGLKKGDQEIVVETLETFPLLEKDKQFWWQIVLMAKVNKGDRYFESQIRAVSNDSFLQNLKVGNLQKVPKPFTSLQSFEFYRKRSFFRGKNNLKIKFPVLLPLLQLHLQIHHPKE